MRHFAFVDLSGFTELTEREGDELAVAVVTSFRALLREVCSRRGVRIAKWLGTGAMLVTVEPGPVLEATLELEWSAGAGRIHVPVPVRCGVASGEVILLEGDDYIGRPVNRAARLCDSARGGEVLVDPVTAAHRPRWSALLATEDLVVRGMGRPVSVCRVGLAHAGAQSAPDPVCGIPLSPTTAEVTGRDVSGRELWFCSQSCRDTWEHRPQPLPEDQGSLRTPFIGT